MLGKTQNMNSPQTKTRPMPSHLAEAIAEAREAISSGFVVSEAVVCALLRGIDDAYGDAHEPACRCSLDKPSVFNQDVMTRL